jgi:hypothetical protein
MIQVSCPFVAFKSAKYFAASFASIAKRRPPEVSAEYP